MNEDVSCRGEKVQDPNDNEYGIVVVSQFSFPNQKDDDLTLQQSYIARCSFVIPMY